MSLFELVFISVSLAMDAFTVSMMYGMTIHYWTCFRRFFIAFYFGFFQALMPFCGYYFGRIFSGYIRGIDHYIAFIFLMVIGIHMIRDAGEDETLDNSLHLFDLTILAFATSIDAFAVGMTFAFFDVPVVRSSLIIGSVTSFLCFMALKIGQYLGQRFQSKAMFIGGITLMIMALKILIEHMN